MHTLLDAKQALETQQHTSVDLVQQCLENIQDTQGEGSRAFISVFAERAKDEANAMDKARSKGYSLPPFAGIPISIKDLFDTAGDVTTAGSKALANSPAATVDATIVQRLRAAGFIIMGKCNMTEFAYSGLGINPHYGTPKSPWNRSEGHIPGGSTSGGAVSVSDKMAWATIGTDTGGSCRVPAAFCGIVGFKPTSQRVSQQGLIPLSSSLDSIGPLANSVNCCRIIDAMISGNDIQGFAHATNTRPVKPIQSLRLGVLQQGYFIDQMDAEVAASYQRALTHLTSSGATLVDIRLEEIEQLPKINSQGGLAGSEAYAWHKPLLQSKAELYDPFVKARLEFAKAQPASDYIEVLQHRQRLMHYVTQQTAHVDALVMPTVQIKPPKIAETHYPDHAGSVNLLCLRNTLVANFLNRPAFSLPCHAQGEPPVGFMLMGESHQDAPLMDTAECVEIALKAITG